MTLPPVIWKPSPNFWKGPSGYATRAFVNHRIVGNLPGARARFMDPTSNASSHFGIGHNEAGRLVIEQYVALDDDAWTNGDVDSPTWPLIIPGVNPNHYTVTIEHEDGGYANKGVVSTEIWAASVALQTLLAAGDPAAVKAVGITFRADSVIRDLAFVPKDELGFIDHHQIAGPRKPYCFRPWLDDLGFVNGSPSRRDQLLQAVNGVAVQEEDPAVIAQLEDEIALLRKRIRFLRNQRDALQTQVAELEDELAAAAGDEATIKRLRNRIQLIKGIVASMATDVSEA